MAGVQQTKGCGAQETNGWDRENQWLGSGKSMIAAQDTNGWDEGNQWLGSRKSMVGAPEINAWDPAVQPGG